MCGQFRFSFQYDFVRLASSNVSWNESRWKLHSYVSSRIIWSIHFLPTSSLILITEMALFVDTGHLIMLRMFFVYPISRRLCQKQPTSFEMINIWLLARLIFTFHSFHHLGLVDTKRLKYLMSFYNLTLTHKKNLISYSKEQKFGFHSWLLASLLSTVYAYFAWRTSTHSYKTISVLWNSVFLVKIT